MCASLTQHSTPSRVATPLAPVPIYVPMLGKSPVPLVQTLGANIPPPAGTVLGVFAVAVGWGFILSTLLPAQLPLQPCTMEETLQVRTLHRLHHRLFRSWRRFCLTGSEGWLRLVWVPVVRLGVSDLQACRFIIDNLPQ